MLLRSTLVVAVVSSLFVYSGPAAEAVPVPITSQGQVVAAAGVCTIVGTAGPDVLRGTPGDDVICGRGGADRIHGGGGDDVLRGGRGDDVLRGGRGDDVLRGGRGADELRAGRGDDVLRGGRGNDLLHARHRRHEIDRLTCGRGSDTAVADVPDRVAGSCEIIRRRHRSPTAVADARSVEEDSGITVVAVLANDQVAGRGPVTVAAVSQPLHGTSTVVEGGRSVTYRPAPDYCSTAPRPGADVEPDAFTYRLAPGGSSATVRVTVTCVDDLPVAVDDTTSVVEDDDATEIQVLTNDRDVDGGPMTIEKVTSARLGTVTVLRGGAGLAYRPDRDACTPQGSPDRFTYTLNGGSSAAVEVSVRCDADAPRIAMGEGSTTYVEGASAAVLDPGAVVTDPDGTLAGATVRITSGFDAGQDVLALSGTHPGIVSTWSGGVLRLEGAASTSAYQAALRKVTFRNGSDAPSTAPRTVTVGVVDETDLSATDDRSFAVQAVNDAPVLDAPGSISLEEGGSRQFGTAGGNAITVTDVDAGTGTVRAVLDVTSGRLTLAGTSGLSFTTGDGTADGELDFTGTVDDITTALDGLSYQSDDGFHGSDRVAIVVDDLGNTGAGGARSASAIIDVTVSRVNSAPVNTVPAAQTVAEDSTLSFTGGTGIEVSDTDVDPATGTLEVELSVNHGRLTLDGATGLTLTTGDGTADPELVLSGSPDAINDALDGATYRPDADYAGADTLTITTGDRGVAGHPVALTDTDTVDLTVTAVNDAPVNSVPGTQAIAEDATLTFSGSSALTVSDVDASTLQVTLSAVNGTLTLARTTGLTLTSGTGTNDQGMTFSATKADINAALDGLQFRPTADYHGSAELRIVTSDDGETGSGGILTDTDDVAITVASVNDAPSFAKGPNQVGIANADADGEARPYTIDPWATAISAGPGEGDQSVTFDVFADDEALFDVLPTVSPSGVLRFTPNPAATGTATITVRLGDDGGTDGGGTDTSAAQTFTVESVASGPSITSISPSPLVPGASAILTGREFSPTAANNTVTIGGAAATVTAATATSLTVTVPCVTSGAAVAVSGWVGATATNTVLHPLQVTQRELGVGESIVIDDLTQVGCNELPAVSGDPRYLVAAFSGSTSPTTNSPFTLSGEVAGDPATPDTVHTPATASETSSAVSSDVVTPDADGDADRAADHGHGLEPLDEPGDDDQHTKLLDDNRVQYEVLREEFGTDGVQRRGGRADTDAADLPMSRAFRVSNIRASTSICNNYYAATATRVYAEGKLVIYEDDATPDGLKAANNPAMADYYDKIGDQFNSDMEPIIHDNFGDILRRDAVTDNNGVMIALSTPRINNSFSGVAGFVITCDQFPNDDSSTPPVGGPYTGTGLNGASNFGEFFYLYQPTSANPEAATGTSAWYRTIRSTFIHESKHVASQAARVANDASGYEASWLEEGTARLAEELWARQAIDDLPWKANNGYGSSTNPVGLYCDVRPGISECDDNPLRPAVVMYRHFTSLYTPLFGSNARLLSPFGATASDNASYYYAVSWSLVRYAIDRYGTSEADFLTALTQSTSAGTANLAERTGVSNDQLLGRWVTALALDDRPSFSTSGEDAKFATWDLRGIYAGLNQDLPSTYTLAYPLAPAQFAFGTFTANPITTLRGGGALWYELSGAQAKAQLLRVQGNGGTALPSAIRLAITRVQ